MVNILLHLVTMSVWRSTMTTKVKVTSISTSTLQELATHYGEVFWTVMCLFFLNNIYHLIQHQPTDMGNNELPQEIVERFKGKVIAITGYEMDQVMVTPTGKPGVNSSADVSVPINWAYNHHYMLWMTGSDSEMKYVKPQPGDVSAHGAPLKWKAVDKPSAKLRDDPSIPTSQLFSEGNGGESRKSFHGYPNGYAQLIESPNLWHITPMQIDTRNRDCGVRPEDVKNCTTFTPGPEPKQARYGRGMPENPIYSGLLECPGSSRFGGDPIFYGEDTKTRQIVTSYEMIPFGSCETEVKDASSCFEAAASFHIDTTKTWKNETVSDSSKPRCFVVTREDGTASATYVIVCHLGHRNTQTIITKTQVQHGHIINFAVHARDRTYRRLHDECGRHDVSSRGRGEG